jgi:predicted Zn-dependent protease
MLISDFMVFNSVNDIDIDKISNIIMNEITWSLSKKIQLNSTKNFDIILKNTAAGMFFHECIGHFLEADHYYNSPIRLLKDNKFCSRNITILKS